jgi:hypothetical protein
MGNMSKGGWKWWHWHWIFVIYSRVILKVHEGMPCGFWYSLHQNMHTVFATMFFFLSFVKHILNCKITQTWKSKYFRVNLFILKFYWEKSSSVKIQLVPKTWMLYWQLCNMQQNEGKRCRISHKIERHHTCIFNFGPTYKQNISSIKYDVKTPQI